MNIRYYSIAAILFLTGCTNQANIPPTTISSPVAAVETVNTGAIDGKERSEERRVGKEC